MDEFVIISLSTFDVAVGAGDRSSTVDSLACNFDAASSRIFSLSVWAPPALATSADEAGATFANIETNEIVYKRMAVERMHEDVSQSLRAHSPWA